MSEKEIVQILHKSYYEDRIGISDTLCEKKKNNHLFIVFVAIKINK